MRFTTILLSLLVAGCECVFAQTSRLDVTLTEPGTLKSILGDKAMTVEELSVAGPMNKRDFNTLWKCSFSGALASLDLSKALPANNEIPDRAFLDTGESGKSTVTRLKLTAIVLPENLERIGTDAFANLNITSIDIPQTVRDLGGGAFENCRYLEGAPLVIPEGIEEIKGECFMNCTAVTEFKLPSTLKVIGSHAFKNTGVNCKEIKIPEGVEVIERWAFNGSHIERVVIPASCRSVESYAFQLCPDLVSIVFAEGSRVERIPEAFADFSPSLRELVLPDGLKEIWDLAFAGCESLTELKIPGTVTSIWPSAFIHNALEEIVIPESVGELGCLCFDQSAPQKLRNIRSLRPVPPMVVGLEYYPFFEVVSPDTPVYVPAGSVEAYRTSPGWNYFTNIAEDPTSGIGDVFDAAGSGGADAGVIYDLMGRRVTNPLKGHLYIKGGKKYIHQ